MSFVVTGWNNIASRWLFVGYVLYTLERGLGMREDEDVNGGGNAEDNEEGGLE